MALCLFLDFFASSFNLRSISITRLCSREIQNLVQNTSSFNPYTCVTCYNPCVPLLKFITADDTPMLNVVRPTNISFGHLFQITLFKDLLLFCVFPCKHVDNSSLILRFINTSFNNFLILYVPLAYVCMCH